MSHRTVVIGAGFCGTVLAANLLRRPPTDCAELTLVERAAELGRGVAYATREHPYLLNVPAGRLSADSQDPLQFLEFARRTRPRTSAEDFLPRHVYGDYLQDFLERAQRAAPSHIRLQRIMGEALGLKRASGAAPLAVTFADREAVTASHVILACGNPRPALLPSAEPLQHHPAYRDDPWARSVALRPDQLVVIIGSGLTMADVVFSLTREDDRAPHITTISRRGLLPLSQSTFHAAAIQGDGAGLLASADSIRQLLAATRGMARDVEALGGDWRGVVTFVRNLAPVLWRRLPERERRRFVRHLRTHWDVHRHRLPPALASHLERLRRSGRLEVRAGRILELSPAGPRLNVQWRPRGRSGSITSVADAVVNASGPDFSLSRSREPLLRALIDGKWISEDVLGLGLRTAANGACIGADGRASEHLYYLGPMLRAEHWEATAATELRNHAEQLSRHLAR